MTETRYDRYEITIEGVLIHKLTRADVNWTDEEWATAVEAAIANETDAEPWYNLKDAEAEEGYIQDVKARVLADDEQPYLGRGQNQQ